MKYKSGRLLNPLK